MLSCFTLHFDTTLALFKISIPISYKQHTNTKLEQCEKKILDLEDEVAAPRNAQDNADNTESVEISEMQEKICDLEVQMDFVTRGKDDEDFAHCLKEDILNELSVRISRG